jgi:segregation and condensation protein B
MQDPIEPSIHEQAIKDADIDTPTVKKSIAEEPLVEVATDEDIVDEEALVEVATDEDNVDEDAVEQKAMMPVEQLQKIIESALMAYSQPLTIEKLQTLFTGDHLLESGVETVVPEKNEILTALVAIAASCHDRGFELKKVSSGWRFQVRVEMAPWINKLWEEKPQRYSRALLETLSIIAYRQPITRGDIEEIRGVAVSSHIIKTLSEREWIKAIGHRDVPGRPSLFATTKQFLDYFNLENLEDLPSLRELADIDSLTPELDFQQTKTPAVDNAADINDSDNLELDLALDNKLDTQLDDNENAVQEKKEIVITNSDTDTDYPENSERSNSEQSSSDNSDDQTLSTDHTIDNLPS